MNRYCPCGVDCQQIGFWCWTDEIETAETVYFCSSECGRDYQWLRENDPAGARRLQEWCSNTAQKIRVAV
jgi:hypothetical protein